MRSAFGCAALGLLLLLVAGTFDAEPLYVAGIGLMVLAAATSLWVVLAARGVRVTRAVGARRTVEEQPVVIDLVVSGGRLPLPSGFIEDDLLPTPAAMVSGRRRTEVHISARFARRGRKVLPPPRIVISDPLGLATRVVTAAAHSRPSALRTATPLMTTQVIAGDDTASLTGQWSQNSRGWNIDRPDSSSSTKHPAVIQ